MSKERAQRRSAREHEAALRAAGRAADAERRERRDARNRSLKRTTTDRLRRRPVGKDTGSLARRRRMQRRMLVALLLAVNVLVWVVRPDWEARLAALVVSILAAPVLATLLLPRR